MNSGSIACSAYTSGRSRRYEQDTERVPSHVAAVGILRAHARLDGAVGATGSRALGATVRLAGTATKAADESDTHVVPLVRTAAWIVLAHARLDGRVATTLPPVIRTARARAGSRGSASCSLRRAAAGARRCATRALGRTAGSGSAARARAGAGNAGRAARAARSGLSADVAALSAGPCGADRLQRCAAGRPHRRRTSSGIVGSARREEQRGASRPRAHRKNREVPRGRRLCGMEPPPSR
jgi:hypothetical protein